MYIKKSVIEDNQVEAISFEDLIKFGLEQDEANVVEGMPWNFMWQGFSVTHENDDHYIVDTIDFKAGEVLVINTDDELEVHKENTFMRKYYKL